MHHPVRGIGSIEGRAWPQGHLDPVDVQVVRRERRVGIEPQGRDTGVPVVDDREQRTGEDVVEAAGHEGPRTDASLGSVDARDGSHVVGDRGGRGSGNFRGGHRSDRGRGVQRLLLASRGRNHDGVEDKGLGTHGDHHLRGLPASYANPVNARGLVTDQRHDHRVGPGGHRKREATGVVRALRSTLSERIHSSTEKGFSCLGIGYPAVDGALLRLDRSGQRDGRSYEPQECGTT